MLRVSDYYHKYPSECAAMSQHWVMAGDNSQGPCSLRNYIPEAVRQTPDKQINEQDHF